MRTYVGGATAVKQVSRVTPGGTIEVGDKFVVTLTGEDGTTQTETVSATATTVSQTCTDIAARLNASTQTLFSAITWAVVTSTHVTGTADTAGEPFYISVSTTESDDSPSDGQTFTTTTNTPSAGPEDFNTDDNWAEGKKPVAGDDIVITGNQDIRYGLRQSSNVTANFTVSDEYSGRIGSDGLYLDIRPSGFFFAGTGESFINLGNAGIAPRAVGEGADRSILLHLLGSAMTTLRVEGINVGVAEHLGQTSTVADVHLSDDGAVTLGTSVSLSNYLQESGEGKIGCPVTGTATVYDGTLTTYGAGAIATLVVYEGTVIANSTGAITTATLHGGEIDGTKSPATRSITTLTLHKGASFSRDPGKFAVATLSLPDFGTLTMD